MDVFHLHIILEFFAIGGLAGILAGLFGVGGGLIMGPFLIFYFEDRGLPHEIIVQLSFGTGLFVIIFTSLLAVWRHHMNGNVIWRAAILLGVFSIAGAFGGSTIVAYTPGDIIQKVYGFALFIFAYRFVREGESSIENKPRYDLGAVIPSGISIGFVSGLLGIGGGIVAIPLMALLLRYPFKKIAGTSSATIIFASISAVISYVYYGWDNPSLPAGSFGFVNLQMALLLLSGTLAGTPLGVYIHKNLPINQLRIFFALFLIAEAIKLLL